MMKKNLLFLLLLAIGFITKAQEIDKTTALQLVGKNLAHIGLSAEDFKNVIVSNAYKSGAADLIYLQQSYQGLPVYNQIQVLAFKDGKLFSNAGARIADIGAKSSYAPALPVVSPADAVKSAVNSKKIEIANVSSGIFEQGKFNFGKSGIAYENITAELMWVPIDGGKEVKLAWQVYFVPEKSSDYWMIRVDARNNRVLDENNLTVYCNWDKPSGNSPAKCNHQHNNNKISGNVSTENNHSEFNNVFSLSPLSGPSIVNAASYRVIPFPVESPKHPGGAPAVVNNPWSAAPGNATSLKWHSNGTTDYNITRGNNVWAQEDGNGNNGTGLAATSTTSPDPLSFNFAPNFNSPPNQTAPALNQQFNITNLFYWNNIMHDISYLYGFDEPAGNFQANNQGRGGAGNDFVLADAQDGGGTNNANFSTPADGGSGRMQMYLWNAVPGLTVNTPATIAGPYSATESAFSTANLLANVGPRTGQVVYYNDLAATTHEACVAPSNTLGGKIALIIRGNCNFTVKVKNAQNAGAIAVIVVNNVSGDPIIMGGTDNTITIPAVMVSSVTGNTFIAQLANNLNVTLSAGQPIDGDVDNGVIAHEYAHGISGRLTGGPSQSGCLSNAEQAGEGWSDYYGLMVTQNWATSNLNSGFLTPRAVGTYAFGQTPGGSGIRTQRYSTDLDINNRVYDANISTESHDRGEIWCAVLWDMTWKIINQVGTINPNIYDAAGGGGNTIALRLVTEGMKLQPCSPGFIDARNAILEADTLLYSGAYSCSIKEAFRVRGMGANASQGSSNSVTDQVADFAPLAACNCTAVNTTTQPANTNVCSGSDGTITVAVTGSAPAYQWQVSTNGGTTFSNIPGATSATLNLTAVTTAMNNNLYRVLITNTCPSSDTSATALLTVTEAAAITAQPLNSTACIGANASFSVTATGSSNTFQWQVSTNGGTSFTDIPGATSSTLNLTGVTAAMSGNQYQVIISSCGPTGITSVPATLTVNNSASITAQPANSSACTGGGGTASFSVTAAGSALTYQWQVSTNGGTSFTDVPGATSATLSLTGVTAAQNNNLYQVVISNACSASVTSTPALLTVSDPAAITSQPANATLCAGADAAFTVTATGTANTYQWQVSTDGGATFTDIPGATSATLNLTAVTPAMNNNQYHLVVTSCSPTGLNSNNVTLTVNSPAAIGTQPANITACTGTDAVFTVAATGTALSYQWQLSTNGGTSFTNIAGATTATLTVPAVSAAQNNNLYHVILTNLCSAAVTSANAVLTVSNNAVITAQPVSATACAGSPVAFSATASGTSYQWQISTDGGVTFTDIPGETTTTLSFAGVTEAMNNNQYRLVVFSCGPAGLNSAAVTLTVNSPAAIAAQPADASACIGNDATFTVTATGTAPAYQWELSTDGGITYNPIAGATAATLTVPAVTTAMNNYLYRVVLSNICTGALTSNPATLTVSELAVINNQPVGIAACPGSNAVFTVAATGPGLTYQWQVSTDGGASFTNISTQTAATLTLTALTAAMNNNQYRAVISSSCSAAGINSDPATLTVYPLPTVAISASPYTSLAEGMTTTLTATSTPPATTFSWFKNGVQVTGATTNTITVDHDNLGAYYASVSDANGCSNTSNTLTIADSTINTAFIYPNPNNGNFWVRFPGIGFNGQPRIITMYDSKGARVYSKAYIATVSNEKLEVLMQKLSSGVYMLVLSDVRGETLATGKVIIL